jgi:hypothetical protein
MRDRSLLAIILVSLVVLMSMRLAGGGERAHPSLAYVLAFPLAQQGLSVRPVNVAEKALDDGVAMYPRAIRLEHSASYSGRVIASVSTASTGGLTDMSRIYESADGGLSFQAIGEVRDPQAGGGRGSCCGSLFELPQRLGPHPSGTLLFGTTVGMKNAAPQRLAEIRVWKSLDHGRNWTYLSSCAIAPRGTPSDQGIWEPEFSVDSRGRLVCYFSDETQTGYSQVLAGVVSTDGGLTWGARKNIVATASRDRPGMAVVRRLPNGTYLMTYELCGRRDRVCRVHLRTSVDGWDWGDPRDSGTPVETADGKQLLHAPTIAWAPGGGPDGRILLVGGLVANARGKLLPESGSTILVNTANGVGQWRELKAPVRVRFPTKPEHEEVVCSNYSSSLLPSADGSAILELATKRTEDGICRAFFATGPMPPDGVRPLSS